MKQATKKFPPGRGFEIEIEKLLKEGGFNATSNARAAHPRQTDIYARTPGLDLLVEVKDRKRKIDVADIDELRARLLRTASDVVGAIFTTSSITRGAIKAIESDRTREIIVLINNEIEKIRSRSTYLRNLINRKRSELRIQGRAWFGAAQSMEFLRVQLPHTTTEFRHGEETKSYFSSKSGFVNASYALDLPDPGWGRGGGDGSLLSIDLTLSTIDDLRDILGCLHEKFGLSANGAFSIHQSDACWHGIGAENLLQAVKEWRKRYKDAALKRVHHSEDIMYFDQLRDGRVVLSTRQRVFSERKHDGRESWLHDSELSIQLPGIPIDTTRFLELCRYTGNEWGQFEYLSQRMTHKKRLNKKIKLRVVGTVVQTFEEGRFHPSAEHIVKGVIAHNPFYRKKSLPKELQGHEEIQLHDLLDIELLLCDLRDHHEDGDVIDWYVLEGFETTWVQAAQIIRPFGTWHEIIENVRDSRTKKTSSGIL